MNISYIKDKTTSFYSDENRSDKKYVLIYGDEIELTSEKHDNLVLVRSRGRYGWVLESETGGDPVLEVYYIDVGQGDSTFIVTPQRKKILIDGGEFNQAIKFFSWKYRLWDREDPIKIDLLVLSHPDKDHLDGLYHFLNYDKIQVDKIIHSGVGLYKTKNMDSKLGKNVTIDGEEYLSTYHDTIDELDDSLINSDFKKWKNAVKRTGADYNAVHSGSQPILIKNPDIKLEFIGPKIVKNPTTDEPMLKWFDSGSKTVNGNSVVMKLTYDKISFLFCGDMNEKGGDYLASDPILAHKLDSLILKAPHHGSHDYSLSWLQAVNPQISVVSSGDEPDHGHPRPEFLGTIGKVSRGKKPYLFSTEVASVFVDITDNLEEEFDLTGEVLRNLTDDVADKSRRLFKKRLHGMVNIRTDGKKIFTGIRVNTGYHWVSNWKILPEDRSEFKAGYY